MSGGVGGKTRILVDTASIADGDSIASYLVDSAGALLTSTLLGGKQRLDVINPSEFAEDSAHTTGDYGQFVLAVRNDAGTSLAGTDGDYAPFSLDSSGRLRVVGDFNATSDYVYAEDSVFSDGDLGAYVLGVRQDTLATDTSADGDYQSLKMNALGEVYVHDTDSLAQLVLANASLDDIETAIEALRKLEDSAHVSGDSGIMALAVRNDAGTALAADGDYIPLSTDANGALRVFGTFNEAGDYAEDSGHVSGDTGYFQLGVRNDDQATTVTSANADYSQMSVDDRGALWTKSASQRSNLQQVVTVGTTAVALPTTPLTNRTNMFIQHLSLGFLYLGSATVTNSGATRGFQLGNGGYVNIDVGPGNVIYGICNSAAHDVVVWEFA